MNENSGSISIIDPFPHSQGCINCPRIKEKQVEEEGKGKDNLRGRGREEGRTEGEERKGNEGGEGKRKRGQGGKVRKGKREVKEKRIGREG